MRTKDTIARDPVAAVLINGTVGSGKTALAIDIGDVMAGRDLPTAILDLDWLGWLAGPTVRPGDPDHLILLNLASVWPNYLAAGARFAVLVRAVCDRALVDGLKRALGNGDLTIVRVTASPETIEARLMTRDTGAELEEHLLHATALTRSLDEAGVEDFVVSNEGRPIREVSLEVIRRLNWPSPG